MDPLPSEDDARRAGRTPPTEAERARRRALGRPRVAESRRRADLLAECAHPKLRLPRATRVVLLASLAVTGGAALAMQFLTAGHLRDTTAFFVGLPVLLGVLTIQLTRTSTPLGQVMQSSVIFLAIVAPVLGEGSICLLMAAPLFLGVAALIAFLVTLLQELFSGSDRRRDRDTDRRDLFCFAWILLPVVWGWVERRVAPGSAAPIVVRSVTTVDGTPDEWRVLVRAPVLPAATDSVLLKLGFPLPVAYDADGDVATLTFHPQPMPGGEWRLARAVQPDGIDFVKLDDTTMIATWLELREHRVRVRANVRAPGKVDVEQTTVFVPLLAPHWYFDTAERWAIEAAQRLAVDSWSGARRRHLARDATHATVSP
jgi:hypothetical protein